MIIEIGTKMLINNAIRGEFYAKARRSFSLDDDMYPVTVIDPLESSTVPYQEVDLRAATTKIELLEEESEEPVTPEAIVDGDVIIQPLTMEVESEQEEVPFSVEEENE